MQADQERHAKSHKDVNAEKAQKTVVGSIFVTYIAKQSTANLTGNRRNTTGQTAGVAAATPTTDTAPEVLAPEDKTPVGRALVVQAAKRISSLICR